MVIAKLLLRGFIVLTPYGDNERYDLVIEDYEGQAFVKVQSKTGRLENGAILFATCSSYAHRGGVRKHYHGAADYFGVYCPQTDDVYIVPVGDVPSVEGSLRVDPPKIPSSRTRWAKPYLL